jgi:hypothetical protein
MIRILIGGFLIAHGLVHIAVWATPRTQKIQAETPFDPSHSWLIGTARGFAAPMAVVVAVILVAAGIALFAHASLWRPLAVAGLGASLFLYVLYFNPWLDFITLVNAAVLAGLVWWHWPSATRMGGLTEGGAERRATMWPKSYAKHIAQAEQRLLTFDSRTVDSPWGSIEYVERGTGIPLLVSHGIAGGHDAAVVMAEVWAGEGFRVIGPSRFGYFRSALPKGAPTPLSRPMRSPRFSTPSRSTALRCLGSPPGVPPRSSSPCVTRIGRSHSY